MYNQLDFSSVESYTPSTDEEVLNAVIKLLNKSFLKVCKVVIKHNSADYNSIVIKPDWSPYHGITCDILFARIKTKGKVQYLSFKNKYRYLFYNAKIPFSEIKSEKFIRIELGVLSPSSKHYNQIGIIFREIFEKSFSVEPFGCCDKCEKCSDAMHCIHPDLIFSTGCQYKKNLEQGKIFFGKRRNVD